VAVTGESPKRIQRIQRLNALVADLDRAVEPAWAHLAVRHGYFDQPHLIREVRALTGLAPTRLHAERLAERRPPVRSVQSGSRAPD
jgi:methylphosphotriester-DNA--protein-cysteine methyltransferase